MKTEVSEGCNVNDARIVGPTTSVFAECHAMCTKSLRLIYARLYFVVSVKTFTYMHVCKITECCNVFYVYGVSGWNSNRQVNEYMISRILYNIFIKLPDKLWISWKTRVLLQNNYERKKGSQILVNAKFQSTLWDLLPDLTIHLKEMLWLPIEAFNLSDLHSIRYAFLATDHLCFWYFQQMVTLALPFHGCGKVIKIPRKIEKTIPRRLPAGHGNPFNLLLQDSQNWLHLSSTSQLLIRDILWNDPCCL